MRYASNHMRCNLWQIGFLSCLVAVLLSSCLEDQAAAKAKQRQVSVQEPETVENPNGLPEIIVGNTSTVQLPITFEDGSGLSADIITALNEVQEDYYFLNKEVPAKRLIALMESGRIQVAAFHNINWGFDAAVFTRTRDIIQTKDVYVTLASYPKCNEYLDDPIAQSKVGVLGFHYSFYRPEDVVEDYEETYNLNLVTDELKVLKMIEAQRAKIGIVSTLTLDYLEKTDPQFRRLFVVSSHTDGVYQRYFVLSKQAPITADQLDNYFVRLRDNGKMRTLLQKYGVEGLLVD